MIVHETLQQLIERFPLNYTGIFIGCLHHTKWSQGLYGLAFIAFQGCLIYSLHSNISMQGIYTVLYTFPLYNQELLEFAIILLFS